MLWRLWLLLPSKSKCYNKFEYKSNIQCMSYSIQLVKEPNSFERWLLMLYDNRDAPYHWGWWSLLVIASNNVKQCMDNWYFKPHPLSLVFIQYKKNIGK